LRRSSSETKTTYEKLDLDEVRMELRFGLIQDGHSLDLGRIAFEAGLSGPSSFNPCLSPLGVIDEPARRFPVPQFRAECSTSVVIRALPG